MISDGSAKSKLVSKQARAAVAIGQSNDVITGLPDYRPPIEQSLRCVCGQRFVVYLGAPFPFNEAAFEAARERAEQMNARFVDARESPWLICSCGDVLMFVEDAAAVVM